MEALNFILLVIYAFADLTPINTLKKTELAGKEILAIMDFDQAVNYNNAILECCFGRKKPIWRYTKRMSLLQEETRSYVYVLLVVWIEYKIFM